MAFQSSSEPLRCHIVAVRYLEGLLPWKPVTSHKEQQSRPSRPAKVSVRVPALAERSRAGALVDLLPLARAGEPATPAHRARGAAARAYLFPGTKKPTPRI